MKKLLFLFAMWISIHGNAQSPDLEKDTAAIEFGYTQSTNKDPSTHGMNIAAATAAKAYDKLLNSYYKICMGLLKAEDKKKIIDAQKAWMIFRDKEIQLLQIAYTERYTGGGTMWSIVVSEAITDLTRKRVVDLYNYWEVLAGKL